MIVTKEILESGSCPVCGAQKGTKPTIHEHSYHKSFVRLHIVFQCSTCEAEIYHGTHIMNLRLVDPTQWDDFNVIGK